MRHRVPVFLALTQFESIHWKLHNFARYRVENQYADPVKRNQSEDRPSVIKIAIFTEKIVSRRFFYLQLSRYSAAMLQCNPLLTPNFMIWYPLDLPFRRIHSKCQLGYKRIRQTTCMNALWTVSASSNESLQHWPVIIAWHVESVASRYGSEVSCRCLSSASSACTESLHRMQDSLPDVCMFRILLYSNPPTTKFVTPRPQRHRS